MKQSGKSKYVAHVLGEAVSKKYGQQHYYGKPKYVAHVLGEAVSKKYGQQHYYGKPKYVVRGLGGTVSRKYIRLLESKNYRHGKLTQVNAISTQLRDPINSRLTQW